ncbi:NACHT domain-containing protein [Streptomyces sp. NPDC002122]|uniref:NACHT domain-containing protein n=1 Tax=Streptomyces sp. NPDC002122 TaxID=3154407 RepID=UPI0033209E66
MSIPTTSGPTSAILNSPSRALTSGDLSESRPTVTPTSPRVWALADSLSGQHATFSSAVAPQRRPTLGTIAADEWLASGTYRLLVGRPGVGKSSLLRFMATDLLSPQPQSITLQREHAGDLPIWLPFGYLCRHLEESTENSFISAVEAWLASQSAPQLWPLVQRALRDDRLLLLIDGVDEWTDVDAAERALGVLEAFLGHTEASAILSTRSYAVDRLNWQLHWTQAEISPLTDRQRRTIAAGTLRSVAQREAATAFPSTWSAGVESFLDQVEAAPELSELSRSPLFLTLLAATWQGEALPRQRFEIYARLVELLVAKHPQMRKRASHARRAVLAASVATTLFAAVAYRLRVKDPTGAVTQWEMRELIIESMTDDDVLGYQRADARRIADEVLAMAENEFGLIVSHGAGFYGFLHRVVLDHLAGQYLAMLPVEEQIAAIQRLVHDPAWRDVLLALLTAQLSSQTTMSLLSAALDTDGRRWADVDGYELLAEALAAGIRLTPRARSDYISSLVERVETHPSLRHRANLITELTGMLVGQAARTQLLPIMKRWLTAPRPDPSPTMWALRDLDIADEVALEYLLWGIRHPEDNVKVNAAMAIAHRFGGRPRVLGRLLAFAETGPSSAIQAAAILALGNGWPDAPQTTQRIDWARRQPSRSLRLVGLHLLQQGSTSRDTALFRPEERDWLLSLLRREDHFSGPWPVVDLVTIAATGDSEVADFALETLTTNGRNGGDRSLAWMLACNTFAYDRRFKDWVITELETPDNHGLILYNVGLIPDSWSADPAFAQALSSYVETELRQSMAQGVAGLATALSAADARTVLLRGLDASRPYAAARTLVERYADDQHVQAVLASRLHGDFAQAAPFAGVAVDVLGHQKGFAVLVSLLRQTDEDPWSERRVVVAQAVAEAWRQLENAVREPDLSAEAARETLASYDPAELAALCAAVKPHPLMWHVPVVINAWPEQPAVQRFAEDLIRDTRPITAGIPDSIPAAILRAYCGRSEEASLRIVDKTLNLLKHIEPELREVLAFELSSSSLTAADLIDVVGEWKDEPDTEIRRSVFIGLIQSVKRYQQSRNDLSNSDASTPEMEWARDQVKSALCAYGPELEERRQLAWIGMLLLGDLTLIDGISETIGRSGVPGVKLGTLYDGDVDQILVDLVAEKWEDLRAHFGNGVFERLNGRSDSSRTASEQRLHVMSALATVASRHPDIAEMLRREAGNDVTLRGDGRFLLWAKEENRGDEEVLRALVTKLGRATHHGQDPVLDSILDRSSWNVSDEVLKRILVGESIDARPRFIDASGHLAVYTQLFPTDALSVAAYRDLEAWFGEDPETRQPRVWGETLAIAFGAAEAKDLPTLAVRSHSRIRMGMSDLHLPIFAKPLLRRLRVDTDAVDAFKDALGAPMSISEDSPIMAASWDPISDAHPAAQLLQRTYLFAVVLRQAGVLPQAHAAAATHALGAASPDTVVYNPFTGHEGPLCLAVLDLAPH